MDGDHPSVGDGEVLRKVYLSDRKTDCKNTLDIFVKDYRLHPPPVCNSRYWEDRL